MPEAAPSPPLAPTPKSPFPVARGEGMVEMTTERIAAHISDELFQRRVLDSVRQWARCGVEGQPVILTTSPRPGGVSRIIDGGILCEPLTMADYPVWRGGWHIAAKIREPMRHKEGSVEKVHSTDMPHVLKEAALQNPPHFVVGEQHVRTWVQDYCRGNIDNPDPTSGQIRADRDMLGALARTCIPTEYLSFSDEERATMAGRLLEYVWVDDEYEVRTDTLAALRYVAGATSAEQFQVLLSSINDQIAALLPASPGERMDRLLMYQVTQLLHARTTLRTGEQVSDVQYDPEIRAADYLADLYAQRAAQLANIAPKTRRAGLLRVCLRPQSHPRSPIAAPPAPHTLRILRGTGVTDFHVRQDVAYLRALQAAEQPVQHVGRDIEGMRRATLLLVNHALASTDTFEQAQTLQAMEYLFDVQTQPQREEFYDLLCKRLARTVPVTNSRAHFLEQYVRLASTIGQLMPCPPVDSTGQPVAPVARAAALMSHIYTCCVKQRVGKQLRKYIPVNPAQESSASDAAANQEDTAPKRYFFDPYYLG